MASTPLSDLAVRVQRRLGLTVLGGAAGGAAVSAATVAARALRAYGVPISEAERPFEGEARANAAVAADALQRLGANLVPMTDAVGQGGTASRSEAGRRALKLIGVNPIPPMQGGPVGVPVQVPEVARRTLRVLGVNPIASIATGAAGAPKSTEEVARLALRFHGINPLTGGTLSGTTYDDGNVALLALQRLQVYDPTETPTAHDLARARNAVLSVHDTLVSEGVASWPVTNIPPRAAEFYAIMASVLLATTFEKPADMAGYNLARTEIQKMALSGAAAQTEAAGQVVAARERLRSLGLADWTATQVPGDVADDVAMLAAAFLAPSLGKEMDAAPIEARIREVVLSGPRAQAQAEIQVTAAHDRLQALGLADWPVTVIPAGVADALAGMAAASMAPLYGKQGDVDAAEARVRAVVLSGPRAQAEAEARVLAVRDRLAAARIADWTADAIPNAVLDAVSALAATLLAPAYGKTFDAGPAEAQVRGHALSGTRAQGIAAREVAQVNAALGARGLAWWEDDAVPGPVSGDLAVLVAARVGPVFGIALDAAGADAAEARIARQAQVRGAQNRAEEAVKSSLAELSGAGLISADAGAIPAYAAMGLEALATQAVAPDFGKATDPAAQDAAMARLRLLLLAGPAGQVIAEGHLLDVHADLDARGRTRWSMEDRPRQADEPMVMLAAWRMGPVAGVPVPLTDVQVAEAMLARVTAMPSQGRPVRVEYF